jgi:aminocarboxymuconate-semialdehyde decarboxylase
MRIDVHAHYFPAAYLDVLCRFGSTETDIARKLRAGAEPAEVDARLGMMDDAHVDLQVLSASPQLPYFEREADAVVAARLANDLYAELVRRHPTRFAALAATPLPHVDAALSELERAYYQLGMAGATVATTVLGRPLTDPLFAPFWEELNRRRAILFVHPAGVGACSPLIAGNGLSWPVGAPIEDTVAIALLIAHGITRRYPDVQIVTSHLGGALPMLLARMDCQYPWAVPGAPELPSVVARRLWYDTVAHGHAPALRAAVETFGADRLILGTDYPYQQDERYREAVSYVEEAGLAPDVAHRILDANAERLFGVRVEHAFGHVDESPGVLLRA